MKLALCLAMLVWGQITLAKMNYYPQEFFNSLHQKNNLTTKSKIHHLLTTGHKINIGEADSFCTISDKGCFKQKKLSYREARTYLFGKLHLKKDARGYYIKDVYCHKYFDSKKYRNVGPRKIPDHK